MYTGAPSTGGGAIHPIMLHAGDNILVSYRVVPIVGLSRIGIDFSIKCHVGFFRRHDDNFVSGAVRLARPSAG